MTEQKKELTEAEKEMLNRPVSENVVKPHRLISRDATDEDIPFIVKLAPEMIRLCYKPNGEQPHGIYKSALAFVHCQLDDIDPIRFFVTRPGEIYINPVIVNKTKHPVSSEEGCMSYPLRMPIQVKRANKITVDFLMLTNEGFKKATKQFSGREARIFQHEIDHMDGKYIYD